MNTIRAFAALLFLVTLAGCDGNHSLVYPTDNVSGRWIGTGAYHSGGTYDAELLFRQDEEEVTISGAIRFTDANGGLVEVPYNLPATFHDRTLTFPSGHGAATLSEDGRTLHWVFSDGSGAFDLTRR